MVAQPGLAGARLSELKAFGGREMDTAVAPLGLQVRAGTHVGECEVIGANGPDVGPLSPDPLVNRR
jgi:hypothetical protein